MHAHFRHDVVGQHLPALDGLRGVAILLVVFGHFTLVDMAGLGGLPYEAMKEIGWTGVDLFFVLSGYLITGALLDTQGSPHWARNFYGRRMLRIFPLYFLLLTLYTIVFPLVLPKHHWFPDPWVSDPLWYWTFTANFLVFAKGDFPYEVMAPAWSLAIEEQFYLLWPWVVLAVKQNKLIRFGLWILMFSIIMRVCMVAVGANAIQIFVFTLARLDGLVAGAMVAAWIRSGVDPVEVARTGSRLFLLGLVVAATCLIHEAIAMYGFEDPAVAMWGQVLFYSGTAIGWAGLLAYLLARPTGRLAQLLSQKLLMRYGLYSYAIYLLNDTVAHMFKRFGAGPDALGGPIFGQLVLYLFGLVIMLLLGAGIYHGFEVRFLRLKHRFGSRQVGSVFEQISPDNRAPSEAAKG